MKLRNKKTGGIVDFLTIDLTGEGEIEFCFIAPDGDERDWKYNSLAEFNEEWEDYKTAEPLIKDEKVRKAVRAWYDAIDYRVDKLLCIKASGSTKLEISDGSPLIYISLFVEKGTLANIKDQTYYTIAELCGEEEE